MKPVWTLKFKPSARKDLNKLDPQVRLRITAYFRERVLILENPRNLAETLTGNWKTYSRFRVGDYRIVCSIRDAELVIMVVMVAHRKEVYQ